MSMDPFAWFCFYHLGLDRDWDYRFRNLHHTAAYFGIEADAVQAELQAHEMDADVVKRSDFNLSQAHAEAQVLSITGATPSDIEAFARNAWSSFIEARKRGLHATGQDDVNWEDPLADDSSA